MAKFSVGTTPTFTLTLPNTVDLTLAKNVYFTVTQGTTTVTKTGDDVSVQEHTVSVYMTQVETFKFRAGTVNVQLNWTYSGGSRACTDIVQEEVGDNLLKRVIE